MLDGRLYRGEHLDVGQVTDMDDRTATEFIAKGWARPYAEPAPMTTEQAAALLPTKIQRRRAIR